MVTLAYTTVLLSTILFIALIDMFLHKIPLGEALYGLYRMEFGLGRLFLFLQVAIGFGASLITDRKRRKQKQATQTQESHEQQA